MNNGSFREAAPALGVFGTRQMAAARRIMNNLARGGYFEPLGHGFVRLDAFGTSHKFNSIAKEGRLYVTLSLEASLFFRNCLLSPRESYGLLVLNKDGMGEPAGVAGVVSTGAPALSCLRTASVMSFSPLVYTKTGVALTVSDAESMTME